MLNGGWHAVEAGVSHTGTTPADVKLEQHLNFVHFSQGGRCLLGSSNLASRAHTGNLFLFASLELPIKADKSAARHRCQAPVICGAFLNEDVVIVAEDTGCVYTYVLTQETGAVSFVPRLHLPLHDSWINSISVSPGSEEVITGGADARICVLDSAGLTIKHHYYPAHSEDISCVAASPSDSAVFASSSFDRSALLWDTRLPKPAKALMEGSCGFTALAWKDDHNVAIGSESGMVHVYDVRSNQSIQDIPLQNAAIRKLVYTKSGLLASISDSTEVRLWNSECGKMIFPDSKHTSFISDLAWDPKTEALYSCGFDGQVLRHFS